MNTPNQLSFLPDDYLHRKAQRRSNLICAGLFVIVMSAIGTAFTYSERAIKKVEAKRRTPVFVLYEIAMILTDGKEGGGPDIDQEKYRQNLKSDPQSAINDRWDPSGLWIEALQDNLKKSERALSEANKKLALGGGASGGVAAAAPADETVNGIIYVGRAVEGVSPKDVKGLVDAEKKRIGSGVVTVVLKGEDGRGTVAVGVTARARVA